VAQKGASVRTQAGKASQLAWLGRKRLVGREPAGNRATRGIGERSREGLTGGVVVACGLQVTGAGAGRPWVQPVKNKRISKSG
jgi:hypothetical protein